MNFKPVVASLFALGIVSAPVLGANEVKEHSKHQVRHHVHHVHHVHHGVRAEHALSSENFAQERFMNASNAKSPVASFDWMNRIHFSGMINVDGKYSNRAPLGIVPGFRVHKYTAEFNVNNANLFVDVDVNHCVTGHVGLAYVADSVNLFDLGVNTSDGLEAYTDSIRADRGAVWANGHLGVDEAYITIRDFSSSPFYFRAGKMYVPFGYNPDIYPITESLTQLLSQTRATTAQLGWISNYGLHASIFALDGAQSGYVDVNDQDNREGAERGTRSFTRVENWGANVGYCSAYSDIRYHVAGSYLKDIRDVEYLAALQDLTRFNTVQNFPRVPLLRQSGGAAFHGDATYGPLYFSADYVAALRNLDPRNNRQGRHHHDNDSRAKSGDVTGTYFTNVWGYNTGFSLGYQRSWEAERVLLPRWRYQGDICVNVLPHTTLAFEYHYDRGYSGRHHGGGQGVAPVADEAAFRQEGNNNHHHHHDGDHHNNGTAAIRLGVVF